MELQQLKYFKVVAETGKLSDAAQRLFISSPALSASISRLEKDLGCRLFDRTGNGIHLNHQGEIFLKYVIDIFNSIDSAKAALSQSVCSEKDHIGVACVSSTSWVDLVSAFSQSYPDLILSCAEIKPEELETGALSPRHDFFLAPESNISSRLAEKLDSMVLFEDDILIAVSPDHPLASRQRISIHEISGENLLIPMPGYPLYHNLRQLFHDCNLPLPENNAYSYLMAIHMAANGTGIAFSTSHMKHITSLPLVYIPITDPHPRWTCCLYWAKEKNFAPEHKLFQKFAENYYSAG